MGVDLGQPSITERIRLYSQTGRRAASLYGLHPRRIVARPNPEAVFIVGCPRSGTTFTASAVGRVSGFVDLGEVSRLKAGIPGLYLAAQAGWDRRVEDVVRHIFVLSQYAAMAAPLRGIEQTPESTFLIPQLARAFPLAHFIHMVRDGRDVAASLIERGWLAGVGANLIHARAGGETVDDAGHPFGGYARFWVEPERHAEFEAATEARRCAWAWRRYETCATAALDELDPQRVSTIRYEDLTTQSDRVAVALAESLGVADRVDQLAEALSNAHPRSIGRYAELLTEAALSDVLDEAGELLLHLGYTR